LEKPNGSASPETAIVQDLKGQRPRYVEYRRQQDKEVSRGVVLESSAITGQVPELQLTKVPHQAR